MVCEDRPSLWHDVGKESSPGFPVSPGVRVIVLPGGGIPEGPLCALGTKERPWAQEAKRSNCPTFWELKPELGTGNPSTPSVLKIFIEGTSLVVQWLRLHTSTAGTRVRSMVGGLRCCMPHGTTKEFLKIKKKKKKETKKLYWSIVQLQCCVNFCTAKWLSYIYILFSYSFPLWFITGYWIQFPVLYRRTLLSIHPIYSSLYLLIPNSQPIPPPPPTPSHPPHLGGSLRSPPASVSAVLLVWGPSLSPGPFIALLRWLLGNNAMGHKRGSTGSSSWNFRTV